MIVIECASLIRRFALPRVLRFTKGASLYQGCFAYPSLRFNNFLEILNQQASRLFGLNNDSQFPLILLNLVW